MKQTPEKDYTHKGWIAATALILVLLAVSFIPPQTIGGIKLRRANILSDLLRFDDSGLNEGKTVLFDEEDFRVDMQEVAELIVADTAPKSVQVSFEWMLPGARTPDRRTAPDSMQLTRSLVPIEDFDTTGMGLRAFCDTLLNARRPVRIAVLGDSFIEGDILTADLREKLQQAYGGGGAGFAPMASPLTGFRRTIKTQSKGWTAYNIMQRKAAPTALRENFFVSGWVCQPVTDASTRWESSIARARLDNSTTGRILFISPENSHVEVLLNDTLRQQFTIEGDPSARQIVVTAPHIRSLTFKVRSGAEGFIGYGAVFESNGVVVDNYSIRSNNGQAMFWTNPSVNAQIDALMKYDLVILQYGLNIMQAGVRNYADYGRQIEKMVTYVRQCFPGAAVLVLGVSDRAVKTDSGFEQMDAVPHMLACQRHAAEQSGAAFWPTCEAMRNEGGINNYVANGWAGKDYTHINYAGGRRVAWALFDALNAGVHEAYEAAKRAKIHQELILDTVQLKALTRELTPGSMPFPMINATAE